MSAPGSKPDCSPTVPAAVAACCLFFVFGLGPGMSGCSARMGPTTDATTAPAAGAASAPVVVPDGMVFVPAGVYLSGSDDEEPDEAPAAPRNLPAFFIDRTEVSQTEYAAFLLTTGHPPPSTSRPENRR